MQFAFRDPYLERARIRNNEGHALPSLSPLSLHVRRTELGDLIAKRMAPVLSFREDVRHLPRGEEPDEPATRYQARC
jgi:hypothetical protein